MIYSDNSQDYPKDLPYLKNVCNAVLSDVLTCRTLNGNLFGVEIENELTSREMSPDFLKLLEDYGWARTADGSLRGNGYEFISPPSSKTELLDFFKKMTPVAKKLRWSYSRRTSVHIHINVADLTFEQLYSFIALYYIFEGLLYETTQEVRKDNTFCVSRSMESKAMLLYLLQNKELLENLPKDEGEMKYASLNIHPLRRFGTVECRIFHTTFDYKDFKLWLDFFNALKVFVMKPCTLTDVKQLFIDLAPEEFTRAILGKETGDALLQFCEAPKARNLLREGFSYTRSLLNLDKVFKALRQELKIEQKRQEALYGEYIEFARSRRLTSELLKDFRRVDRR
jgi:Putative amidoligase enzyme